MNITEDYFEISESTQRIPEKKKKIIILSLIFGVIIIVALGLGFGLGFGLKKNSNTSEEYCNEWNSIFEKISSQANITLSSNIDCEGKIIKPVSKFSGSLNGNNYSLRNFNIKNLDLGTNEYFTGLFGIFEGSLKNIKFQNIQFEFPTVSANQCLPYSTGIISNITNSEIKNVTITGFAKFGNIFGSMPCYDNPITYGFGGGHSQNSYFSNIELNITILKNYSDLFSPNIGGLIGLSLDDSFENVRVVIEAKKIKDRILSNDDCYGGILGWIFNGTINNCSSTITINNSIQIGFGGVMGDGYLTNLSNSNTILYINSNENSKIGGFSRNSDRVLFSNCNCDGFIKIQNGGTIGGISSEVTNSQFLNCRVNGYFEGDIVGGFVGAGDCIILDSTSHVTICSYSYSGGFIGIGDSLKVRNSIFNGSIDSLSYSTSICGGIVGNCAKNLSIYYSEVEANIKCKNGFGGGILGLTTQDINSRIIIQNSKVNINISNTNIGGGIIAKGYRHQISITQSFSIGTIQNSIYGGGIIGIGSNSQIHIQNCYSLIKIIANQSVGGIIGYTNQNTEVITSYSAAQIASSSTNLAGGLIGFDSSESYTPKIKNSYWDFQLSQQSNSNGGQSKTSQQMKQKSNFKHWNFDEIWNIQSNQYPSLRNTP